MSGSFLIKFSSRLAPTKIEELTAGSGEKRRLFSSDPALSSSIFVGAKREETLIEVLFFFLLQASGHYHEDIFGVTLKTQEVTDQKRAAAKRYVWTKIDNANVLIIIFFLRKGHFQCFLRKRLTFSEVI